VCAFQNHIVVSGADSLRTNAAASLGLVLVAFLAMLH